MACSAFGLIGGRATLGMGRNNRKQNGSREKKRDSGGSKQGLIHLIVTSEKNCSMHPSFAFRVPGDQNEYRNENVTLFP